MQEEEKRMGSEMEEKDGGKPDACIYPVRLRKMAKDHRAEKKPPGYNKDKENEENPCQREKDTSSPEKPYPAEEKVASLPIQPDLPPPINF